MSVRIRAGGSPIVCAAMHPELPGDTYIDDPLHYRLSVEYGVLVSEPQERHALDGLWWWFDEVPDGVEIEQYEHPKVVGLAGVRGPSEARR